MVEETVSQDITKPATSSWRGVVLITLVWLGCLLFITVSLSNPVTLNLAQIRKADFICVGTFADGSFQVENCWPDADIKLNRFKNQAEVAPETNTRYIVPITITGSTPEITLAPFDIPLIYPATEETLDGLRAIRKLK